MTLLEELAALGYTLTFSVPSTNVNWGKWFVGIAKVNGPQINGYGDTEEKALENALSHAKLHQK